MLDELQLLEPDKEREKDVEIMKTHLETLLLLTTTQESREVLRAVKVYPIVRECHLHVEDDEVREACDRVVQIIMRKEEGEEEEDEKPARLAPLASSAMPSIRDFLAMEAEAEKEEKRRARKEKKKKVA